MGQCGDRAGWRHNRRRGEHHAGRPTVRDNDPGGCHQRQLRPALHGQEALVTPSPPPCAGGGGGGCHRGSLRLALPGKEAVVPPPPALWGGGGWGGGADIMFNPMHYESTRG